MGRSVGRESLFELMVQLMKEILKIIIWKEKECFAGLMEENIQETDRII